MSAITHVCGSQVNSRIPNRRTRIATVAPWIAMLVLLVSGFGRIHAQEGHPLVGTWHGTWGPNTTERHDVTLVIVKFPDKTA